MLERWLAGQAGVYWRGSCCIVGELPSCCMPLLWCDKHMEAALAAARHMLSSSCGVDQWSVCRAVLQVLVVWLDKEGL
jgi:hypothetical protein